MNENLRPVTINMVEMRKVSKKVFITREQEEDLRCGINPFMDEMEQKTMQSPVEYDWEVVDDDGEVIIELE